ncbi:MAG: cupredoxin domain-containing protein [Leptospirillum sp.]|jgi:hypothetical protein
MTGYPKRTGWTALLGIGLMVILPGTAFSGTSENVTLTLQNHRFTPAKISVLPDKKFVIVLENKDNHPEEFESYDLEFEILVLPHKTIRVPIRPLPKGTYSFFGDFHPKTARGVVLVGTPSP